MEIDPLSVAGMELLNSAIRVNNASLKYCLSKSWVQGLPLAMMIDRAGAERLVQSIKRQFNLYMMSGDAVEADELVNAAVEILRAVEVEGNPAVVKLIKDNWGATLTAVGAGEGWGCVLSYGWNLRLSFIFRCLLYFPTNLMMDVM